MLENNLISAIHWWRVENDEANFSLTSTIPWIFKTGIALYQSIENLVTGNREIKTSAHISGNKNMIINLELTPQDYFYFRGILAMTADLYRITSTVVQTTSTEELKKHLNNVKRSSNKFRDLRNFFEHIDDRLTNFEQHGISGEVQTECGIFYGENTVDCFHLIFDGTSFHFSDEKKAKKRTFTIGDFIPIFEGLEGLYNQLTSHKLHAREYPQFNSIINFRELVH